MKRTDYKSYFKNVIVPVFVYGAFTGLLVGTVVYFFKWIAEHLTEWSKEIYRYAQTRPWIAVAVVAGAAALAFVAYFLQKWAPETAGGGIPRAEGVLRGLLTFRWLRTGIAVIAGSAFLRDFRSEAKVRACCWVRLSAEALANCPFRTTVGIAT